MSDANDIGSATYSPEDNKLRLYPLHRLDAETYEKVKGAGFSWAPKQECFFASWAPHREDLLTELCGEIDDEDKSLVDRAAERAERFEGYRDNRKRDAERAAATVDAIAQNIPLGQPILVGHHSEKRARRDAQKIEDGMRRAVKMWNTADYWKERAAGAIAHAKYKELPRVRARRIKTIQADLERVVREYTPYEKAGVIVQEPFYCPVCSSCHCKEHPEAQEKVRHVWTGHHGRGGSWTIEAKLPKIKERAARWVEHYERRLSYEKAMLEAEGKGHLLDKKPRPEQPPLLNYRQEVFMIENRYHKGQFYELKQIEMTKAEFAKINGDYKGTRWQPGHRIRVAILNQGSGRGEVAVFLTDSKEHQKPLLEDMAPIEEKEPAPVAPRPVYTPPQREGGEQAEAMRESLRQGVQVVSAPQLFPTPPELAARVIEEADIRPGMDVLEPSAGSGSLLRALPCVRPGGSVTAVEIAEHLRHVLRDHADHVVIGDFLELNGDIGKFDRIVMNPPFANGADIRHIQRAASYLKPGGRLVAICANGPRQQAALIPWANDRRGSYTPLPAGSFKESGTSVSTALVVAQGWDA